MNLKHGKLTTGLNFLASCDTYNQADTIIVGVPMDFTCSFRPGARFGPQKIREVSMGIEEYSLYLDKDLSEIMFKDLGDLDLPIGNIEESLKITGEAAEEILQDNKFPLFLGGEHLISMPIIKKVHEKYGDNLVVVQFDAHADLRDEYLGCENSHASVIKRLIDFMPGKNIYQFGVRSGTREEFQYSKQNTNMFPFEVIEPLKKVLNNFKDKPVYITLDIDVLDPAFANGTGTPEPGGISSREMIDALHLFKDINLVGFDLVEVSPVYDNSDRTALLAAKIVREMLLMCNK